MSLSRWRSSVLSLLILTLTLLVIAGCGSESKTQTTVKPTAPVKPTPTVASGPGQKLLDAMAHTLDTAKTLHGIFNLTSSSQAFHGVVETELWKVAPDKSRTEVQKSTLSQVGAGSLVVSDGQQTWQYDPTKKVVYTGKVTHDANTPETQSRGIAGSTGGQSQSLLNIIQSIFDHSKGTLRSSSAQVDGHSAYDIHVVPSTTDTGADTASFNYTGEIYVDKNTQLPRQVDLNINSLGNITVAIPQLDLNQNVDGKLFSFVIPAGTKTLPLADANGNQDTSRLTLAQAQKMAGYHLLSIPGDQSDYSLNGVAALGTPGLQTYTLNYMKGSLAFTLAEGKPLANLPGRGSAITLRGTNGTLYSSNGTTTLAWTEKSIGYRLSGAISSDQAQQIANLLS
ncbi:LolA family protein [Dictyobacter kobayashii]|uniref:Outer membrane lipoprotein carrier protein LolA n=1 Tax=Dictyobacter kobayashii TaxID=2014872 RepID=A0A402AIZ6_9CHLR|nr:hypothetical protein [Dictyobacter kobayashii]GCE19024.1 hypothetical protein KDK_28240 [Dictyobacter kobayashii]